MKLYEETKMADNFRQILDLLEKCLIRGDFHLRPDCEDILKKIKEFSLGKSLVLVDKNLLSFLLALEQSNDDYLAKHFLRKLGIGDIIDLVSLTEITQKRIDSEFLCKATTNEINYLFMEELIDNEEDEMIIQVINLSLHVLELHSQNDVIRKNVISILSKIFTEQPFAQDHLIESIEKMTNKHTDDHTLCIFATECFYSITKDSDEKLEIVALNKVVDAIITAMESHPNNQELLKYAILALKPDRTIEDVCFDRLRCLNFVFNILVRFKNDELNKIAVDLISLLVYDSTAEISNLRANPVYMDTLLDIVITSLTISYEEDSRLVPTFSTLSSLSDYSSKTCDKFVQKSGLDLCLQTLKVNHAEKIKFTKFKILF